VNYNTAEKDQTAEPTHVTDDPSPAFIDTHCHIEMKEFDRDRDEVLARSREAGIESLITIGSDLEGTLKGVALAEQHTGIYCSVGIHPHDAKYFTAETYRRLKELTRKPAVVAIGETGLDFHYDHSPRNVQRRVFQQHLLLAGEAGLPVVIHCREASSDTLQIVRDTGITNGVFHCFSGDITMAEEVMALGFCISLAGPVTFRKAQGLHELARVVPDDYLLIETDAPYLAPEPFRGKRNEPSYLVYTAKRIAELRGVSLQDIARITTLNAKHLFRMGQLPDKGEIAYQIRDSLYLNITNRCTNRCSFCVKFHSDYVKGHRLRLSREPTEEELKGEIGDPARYREIVFCGYGEPLLRLETVKNVAQWIKSRRGRVRINTNGHANLIHGRNIIPELKGIVDSISISLDAQDEDTYNRICGPAFPDAFNAVIRFVRDVKETVPDVQITVVNMPGVDIAKCRAIAEQLGTAFRVRELDVVG
jgi:TatD DNase family protein